MDKILRPERFDADPSASGATKSWIHWKRTFENFLAVLLDENIDKFRVLTNFVSPTVFEFIEECTTYEAALETLDNIYVKLTNEIYARHVLATRRQQTGESLDEYLQALKVCNFQSVTAAKYCEEYIRDAFITGSHSNQIRQRLWENKTLDLKTMFDQARALESAIQSSESYAALKPFNAAISSLETGTHSTTVADPTLLAPTLGATNANASSMEMSNILGRNAWLETPFAINVRKRGTSQKSAEGNLLKPMKFQLHSGHLPSQLLELLKLLKSLLLPWLLIQNGVLKPFLIEEVVKAIYIQA